MVWLLSGLLLLTHAAAFLLWRRFTAAEVRLNAADITANGSADDLRKGYHSRRTWARFWPWLGLSAAGGLPLYLGEGVWGGVLASLALGILLAAYFARYFTPALNVAMNLPYKPEYYASPDSASWPDAAVWKQVRASYGESAGKALGYDQQTCANSRLRGLLDNIWLWGRIAYVALLAGTIIILALAVS